MRPNTFLALTVALATAGCAGLRGPRAIRISSDFPGGSAHIESVDSVTRTVRLTPGRNPGRGWEAWWYFKADGLQPGETLTLDVGKAPWATPDRAMFSPDGKTWQQTPAGVRTNDRIRYRVTIPARSAWFAWGPPFVLADAEKLVTESVRKSPVATRFALATSRERRTVPALRVTAPGADPSGRAGVWIHARQHAWESGSSWVASGLANWLVSDDARAEALRRRAVVYLVPIMDVDNVERGAGGKNQEPHDHNRDWSEGPHWPEVAAAMERIADLNAAGRLDLFIDLHNPAAGDKVPFFFVSPAEFLSERGLENRNAFLAAARTEITGPLAVAEKTRETGPTYDKNWMRISGNWVTRNCRDHVVSVCQETAWNNPASTLENYQRVGRELGLAIERYLREEHR